MHPTYAQRGCGYAWSGQPLACWNTRILGPILDGWTQCGDERRVGLFLALNQTQRLKIYVSRWAKQRLFASAERPFETFLGPVNFHGLAKELYRELVVGSASDPLRHGWTRRRSAPTGIGRQDRASWITPCSRSPGDLHRTRCPFSAWTSKRVWQTCPIVLAAAGL